MRILLGMTALLSCVSVAYGQTFEMDVPHAGCPTKLPTYESVKSHCIDQDKNACTAKPLCRWSNDEYSKKEGTQCHPKLGSVLGPEPTSPDAANGLLFAESANLFDLNTRKMYDRIYDLGAARKYADVIRVGGGVLTLKDAPHSDAHGHIHALMGIAYHALGQKERALENYCLSMAYGGEFKWWELSRQQVEQLTEVAEVALPVPVLMNNGVIKNTPAKVRSKITVKSIGGYDHYIKLVDVATNREVASMYLKSGTSHEMSIPVGTYYIRVAYGAAWYGVTKLFGPDTKYFQFRGKENGDKYPFVIVGDKIRTWTFELNKRPGGNAYTDKINPDQF